MQVYLLFVVGFIVLIVGANWLVEGSVSLGIRAKLSPLVIGLTVVAFGTSLPELVINVFASLKQSSDLAVGNVLGSNIMNIVFIVGVSALILPIDVERISIKRDIPVGTFATIAMAIMANGYFLGFENVISRFDGLLLLCLFGLYLWMTLHKGQALDLDLEVNKSNPDSWPKTILLLTGGVIGLYFGGEWVSDGALTVAAALGISESAVGLTIVAAATSLPELVTAIVAALKKNIGIVMGNVLGSNIINIFVVLGVSALINPIVFDPKLNLEIGLVLLANLTLFGMIFLGKGLHLSRREGVILVLVYVLFIWLSLTDNQLINQIRH